ncbi:MAG: SdrD B-like domain-containing protein [Candidatus Promineifilaceae bacterium]
MKQGVKATFLLVAGFILAAYLVTVETVGAQGQNLLTNPGFEEGHHHQDGIAEITVPDGWVMHWSNRESNIFDGYAETARPETVVWNISGAPAAERSLFWKDGIYTVKIFKGWAPLWAAMSQDVSGLEVGRRYRLVAPIYIDIVADYDNGKKVPPSDNRHGRVRLGASPVGTAWRDEANINYSGWWTADTVSPFYLAYPTFVHEFTATAPDMTVWIEMASNYPHPNNGFFVDTVGLYALDETGTVAQAPAPDAAPAGGGQAAVAAQPAVPATPLPTATPRADGAVVHIVQSGDSFWSLAIRYAETMGLTPEEALLAIPELNGNPSVINSGDELIIVPPSADTGNAVAEAPAGEAATPEGEEAATGNAETEETESDAAVATPVESAASGGSTNLSQRLLQTSPSSICVLVYEDVNGDGLYADVGESPIADQAITLRRAGSTVSTYVTDGSGDLHCFENLEPDTYQVQIYPTADFAVTGDDRWAVAMAEGVTIPVSFGLQHTSDSVAAAGAADETAAQPAAATVAESPGGLSQNTGIVVLGIAAVLALVAGAGIYLLRRG